MDIEPVKEETTSTEMVKSLDIRPADYVPTNGVDVITTPATEK